MQNNTVYLKDVPLKEAWSRFIDALEEVDRWRPLGTEKIPLAESHLRITAEPIWARLSSPHYHAAAMDGYALIASSTDSATDRRPVSLDIGRQASYVDTGDPLPGWADAVIPIEEVEAVGQTERGRALDSITLRSAIPPWRHVRPMGEDIVTTELVVPAGERISPVYLAAIAASGHSSVAVYRKPTVAIIPTGSELVPIGTDIEPGEIIEYNSLLLGAQVEQWGATSTRWEIIRDELQSLEKAVLEAARTHDLVLINAGSSAGLEDFTARVVESLGKLLVHGVAVRPGHPVILGLLDDHTPVIGVPGYPVSAALTGEIFIQPLLARWLGQPQPEKQKIDATLTRKIHSSLGDDEFVRVSVGRVGEEIVATPLSRGAGVITSLVRADGLLVIPAGSQGYEAREKVEVELYRSKSAIERTLVFLGSHDLTIDLLAQFLAQEHVRLTSANIGSLGGLVALSRGEAHLAGSHLLDPESGEFNLPYIRQYLPDVPVAVIALVRREQGLILAKGNPKRINGLEELTRSDVRFVNRQRGAGTRILLDYQLRRLGIDADDIHGYGQEEYSHLMVGASVASGRADCGLGIRAAAFALDLEFKPLFEERYDLVIPKEHLDTEPMQQLLGVLRTDEFKTQVQRMPGYSVDPMGKLMAEIDQN
jgi:putative molybdopterin biosynthesis protein